jgi:hypothetical protein
VGDQDIGRPGRPVSSELQVPVSRGIVVQEQDPLKYTTIEKLLKIREGTFALFVKRFRHSKKIKQQGHKMTIPVLNIY